VLQKTPTVTEFCDRWWQEIDNGSKRNQMSFDYVRWQMGLEVGYLPGNVQDGEFVEIKPHCEQ
jgi:hypothetical protein